MNISVMPGLIDLYRETFEGKVGENGPFITDGKPTDAVFETIAPLSFEQAFAAPVPGGKSVAAHVKHLHFSLDLLHQRMQGADPKADWKSSFIVPPASATAWRALQDELRTAYSAVLGVIEQQRQTPVEKMLPLHVVGLAATVAHNAYHLAAIRQIIQVVSQ